MLGVSIVKESKKALKFKLRGDIMSRSEEIIELTNHYGASKLCATSNRYIGS
jgi:DUF2075 family protein